MAKKQQSQAWNLFEPVSTTQQAESNSSETQEAARTATQVKIRDACPRCGSRSLKTVRSYEHNGHTHYCAGGCLSDDRMDCFYFTPRAETFDEQAKKEEAKKEEAKKEEAKKEEAKKEEAKKIVASESAASSDIEIETEQVNASKYDQEQLFVQPVIEATGKTIESLEYSRARITEVMRKFNGELPQSVMRADRKSRGAADLATGSYDASAKYEGVWVNSSKGCQNGALSAFPQNIGKCCLLLYTEEGDTVFDPFAGHNSRMEFCVRAGRNYIGCDISAKFMQFNRERAAKLRLEYPETFIELHEIDSRKIDTLELQELADFTITSPPYYDIEDYGDEYQQLGKSENYFEFLRSMQRVANGNFAKLKKGAYAVWFINDFRREGVFHAYHIDTFNLLKAAGFEPWDMMITDFGGSFGQCFPAQVVERKILPKRHEYGVIVRKL